MLPILERRHYFDETIWSYALKYKDIPRVKQYLLHREDFLKSCGSWLDSPLVTINPVARHWYEHLTYEPLINARALRIGASRTILNKAFSQQYTAFLEQVAYRDAPTEEDKLEATCYLLLQDRIDDGLAMFKRIDATVLKTRIQYDYLKAYLSFYGDGGTEAVVAAAGAMTEPWLDYPVDRWRKKFREIQTVLDEASGKVSRDGDSDDHRAEEDRAAVDQPSFDFEIEGETLILNYRNLAECQLNCYLMDIELLFSRQPFVQQDSNRFAIVRPNHAETIALPEGGNHRLELPEACRGANAVLEVSAAGQRQAHVNYAHRLRVRIVERHGRIVVENSEGRLLPKTYIKVYMRTHQDGDHFYKDGYTDLRGCFDYASLSTDDLDRVDRFAILVLSEQHGALIREAAPPQR